MGPGGPTPSLMQAEWNGDNGSTWPGKQIGQPLQIPYYVPGTEGLQKNPGVVPTWPELIEGEMDIIPN